MMEKVTITKFRANIMRFLQKAQGGERLIITSRGKQIAQVLAPDEIKKDAQRKLKQLGKSCYIGDIESPIDESWKVLS